MQRFINNPDDIVDETVAGFVRVHNDVVRLHEENNRVVVSKFAAEKGRVGIVTGGGSGHEPAFIGYTGKNMLDAVAVGELFSSPTAKSFLDAIKAADGGAGVAVLYGNYAGDNMNVKMASKMIKKDGIEVATVVANDDVCSAPAEEREKTARCGRRNLHVEDWRCQGGNRRISVRGDCGCSKGHRQLPIHRSRSWPVYLACCWSSELPDRTGQDGSRYRPPWRAWRFAWKTLSPPTKLPTTW